MCFETPQGNPPLCWNIIPGPRISEKVSMLDIILTKYIKYSVFLSILGMSILSMSNII